SCIPDRQYLIDDENLRLQMRCNCKGQPHIHPAAVMFDRRIKEFFYFGESDYLIKFISDFALAHAQDGAIERDVLAAGQLGMEPCDDSEKPRHPTTERDQTLRRLGDAAQNFEERAFAGAVPADDPNDLTALDFEAYVLKRPELLDLVALHDLTAAGDVD